jgi:AcrR family transcriptional regulator
MAGTEARVPARRGRRLGRPPGADGAETRRKLIEAARDHFARDGYAMTTLKDIATSLGMTTGAVYHYFPSKTELFIAVAEDTAEAFTAAMNEQVDPDAPFKIRSKETFDVIALLNARMPNMAAFVLTLDLEGPRYPELAETQKRLTETRDAFFRQLVADAARRKEFRDGIRTEAVTDLIETLRLGMARFQAQTGSVRRHRAMVSALEALLQGELLVG